MEQAVVTKSPALGPSADQYPATFLAQAAAWADLTPEAQVALERADLELAALLAPPPDVRIGEWAERNLTLRKGTSSRPGGWRTESYQGGIFDALWNPLVREVVFRKSTQVGWSAMLNAIAGYYIDADPSPILFVQPSKTSAEEYSKKRIAPLIADCPALAAKIRPANARKAGNTLLLKEFDGGFLRFAFASAAKTLRSDPIRVLICDEIDGYDIDIDGEGSPIEIARRRTDTYEDAKILLGGTPAKPKGLSESDNAFLRSDQRFYWVPCPHCGFMQPLVWRDLGDFLNPEDLPRFQGIFATGAYRLRWDKDAQGAPVPGTIRYYCAKCERGIDEKFKQQMLDAGEWRARFPDRRDVEGYIVAGFAINALYSPWKGSVWSALAQEWHEAQDNPEKLKAFINLRLGEAWDEGGTDKLDAHALLARVEKYPLAPAGASMAQHWQNYVVPDRCCVLVATADVQAAGGGRIEAQVTGFGPGEESWLIAYEVFWGDAGVAVDPNTGISVWAELDKFFLREWRHESGAILRPAICLVDSGDQTDAVYEYVLPRQIPQRRIYACKGVEFLSRPGLASQGTAKKETIRLWNIATVAAKDRIFSRLGIPPAPDGSPRPGYHHLPDWVTEEYLNQLTSEKKITERNRRTRRMYQHYVSTHARNETLDLTVYAHGGLFILQNFIDPVGYRGLDRLLELVHQAGKGNQGQRAAAAVAPPSRPAGHRIISEGIKL
jgi:phage terminase large subunit GpA-like protein